MHKPTSDNDHLWQFEFYALMFIQRAPGEPEFSPLAIKHPKTDFSDAC